MSESEPGWRYDIYYPGGGRLGGCPVSLEEALRSVRRELAAGRAERAEIVPYATYLKALEGRGKPKR